jgi:phosphonate transport system substrate-binding protein
MNNRWITGLLTAACLLLNSASALAQALPDAPLRLGVVPQFPSVELQRNWAPIAQVLAQACGRPVRFQVSLSIPEFESQFLAGEFDIAYMNPYHAVMARQAQGYQPLVREGQRALKGILVVRADSELKSIADLAGQRIAYPAPNAFGASLYMRALLEREHRVMTRPDYVRTHSNAYRHVIAGQSAAAGGVMATFKSEPAAIRDQLRVLYETPPVAPHPLVAHPRVSREAMDCISRTLLQGETDPATAKLLAAVQLPHPVAAVYQRDYQPLERLALDRYVVLEDKP